MTIAASNDSASAILEHDVQVDRGIVYLTFDDGPHPLFTPLILDLLERHGARATFFPLGRRLDERWGVHDVQDLLNRGHALGNHSSNHPRLPGMSQADIWQELDSASTTIEQRAGFRPRCFRAPYGRVDPTVIRIGSNLGMDHVAWDVDPQEWRQGSVESAIAHIKRRMHDGAVILMHDRKWMTVPIVAELLRTFPSEDWSFRALPECSPGGDPVARILIHEKITSPIGSVFRISRRPEGHLAQGWAYSSRFPRGGLEIIMNIDKTDPTVVGVSGPDHRFDVPVANSDGISPVCLWVGDPDGLQGHAFLGCRNPGADADGQHRQRNRLPSEE